MHAPLHPSPELDRSADAPILPVMNMIREFTQRETAELIRQWLDVFGRKRDGVSVKQYLWHVFSAGCYPCISGDEAIAEYEQQLSCEFVILPNPHDTAYILDSRPDSRPFADYFVFPPNMAWTMAFTHEEGWLGPYFARHPNFTALAAANVAQIKKSAAIAHARTQGWM
jgi:hypothetical protein